MRATDNNGALAQPLTARQRQCLRLVAEGCLRDGFPPSYRDLAAAMGVTSYNAVTGHLRALARKGYVCVGEGSHPGPRSLRLLGVRTVVDLGTPEGRRLAEALGGEGVR